MKWQRTALGLHRRLGPRAPFVVVLGPDGVGKSTTIARLQIELERLFGSCTTQRWRPGLIRKVAPDTGNRIPHAKIPRGPIGSIFSLFALVFDFNIGYLVSIRPALARSEAVVFDRYFHDILIDPRRYRYSGPMWLPNFLRLAVPPRKAIFVILDAEEETILSRKQELPAQEIRRQRVAYRVFAERMQRAMIVRTDKSVDRIVLEIVTNITAMGGFYHNGNSRSPLADHCTDSTDELHDTNLASSKP